jgi:aminoglycoside/choline kinase family phosphotransferase
MREQIIKNFLENSGLGGAWGNPLAGDASFRSYRRLTHHGKTLVLMDAPPALEDVRPFIAIAEYLDGLGLSAPKILARDITQGLLVLEDFGDNKFSDVLNRDPGMTTALYQAALEVLIHLHQTRPPDTLPLEGEAGVPLPEYNEALLFEELFLFCDWYLPALKGREDASWRKNLEGLFAPLFERLKGQPGCLTLKDYHADNLMWLPEREGVRRVGLLDFQDALRGHAAYDLVSLLQDARRPFDAALEADMIARYLGGSAKAGRTCDKEDFLAAYEILGAQRNMKIIGIFTRLWKRDGKAAYPKMIPHVWTLLDKNLNHPLLAGVRDWVGRVAAKDRRAL